MKKSILIVLTAAVILNHVLAQQSDWQNYLCSYGLWDFAETTGSCWISTHGGLIRINKANDSVHIFNKANSPLCFSPVGPLCVDSQGVLWIGSHSNTQREGGLMKKDGEHWEKISQDTSFWSTMITGITADRNNSIWFGMGQQIVKYNGTNAQSKQIIPGIMSYPLDIEKIVFDNDNNVWFLAGYGYGNIRAFKNGNFDSLKGAIHSPHLEQDRNGDFWIVEDTILKCFNGAENIDNLYDVDSDIANDNIVFKDSIVPPGGDTIRFFHIDRNNSFYVCFTSDMGILKDGSWTYMNRENSSFPGGSVHGLFADERNDLWANIWIPGERFRIYRYHECLWKDVTHGVSTAVLPNNIVKNFAMDTRQEKWFVCSIKEEVLTHFNGNEWRQYDSTNISELNALFSVSYIDDSLKIWNDSSAIIVYYRHDRTWAAFDNRPHQSSAMKINSSGHIWRATKNGILFNNGNEWQVLYSGRCVYSFCFDSSHAVYAGTMHTTEEPGILIKYENSRWDTLFLCPGYPGDGGRWVTSIVFDTLNQLWFGTTAGLYTYEGENITNYTVTNSDIPGNCVVYVATDKDNNIWVGTDGNGTGMLRDGSWTVFNASNSALSGTSVEQIIADEHGDIWARCRSNGITVIPYSAFDKTNIVYPIRIHPQNTAIRMSLNPISKNLTVFLQTSRPLPVSVTFYDLCGRKIFQKKPVVYSKGMHNINIDGIKYTAKGMYIYSIALENTRVSGKIVLN